MIRTLFNARLARMVNERKRNISRVVLDANTSDVFKGRTPDRVKRCRKLSPEFEKNVNSSGKDPSFHSTRTFCKIESHVETQDMAESPKNGQCKPLTDNQSDTDCNDLKPIPISPLNGLILALDCEMVECVSASGSPLNSLARCSIVDYDGKIILDLYVKQTQPVTDYRYRYSGISEQILREKPCISYKEARDRVRRTIDGKLLLGHSIHHDLQVLDLIHPPILTIDLASKSVRSMLRTLPSSTHKYGLKHLAFNHLNRVIQKGTHCSVEDSQATMEVFKCVENLWLIQNDSIVSSLISYHAESYLNDEYWPDDVDND